MLRRMEYMKGRSQQTVGREISFCHQSSLTLDISEIVDG